jgi:5-hydroxyisourate hydrolase
MDFGMTRISTHILDTALGKPATGVAVRLERREKSGNWQLLGSGRTDQDGRCTQLLPEDNPLSAGIFRLAFDTESYFTATKMTALYPLVEVTFQVRDGEKHFHIPLLLSPNGYTTYRGT